MKRMERNGGKEEKKGGGHLELTQLKIAPHKEQVIQKNNKAGEIAAYYMGSTAVGQQCNCTPAFPPPPSPSLCSTTPTLLPKRVCSSEVSVWCQRSLHHLYLQQVYTGVTRRGAEMTGSLR